MFSDLSRYQTVRGTDATNAKLKVVQLHMNEINKTCSCRPANLIRLRRRFQVTMINLISPRGYQAGDLRMS